MHLVREKKFEEAWRELIKENPFPLICGRVCYRFCEAQCNRKEQGERVSINAVERFLGQYAVEHGLTTTPYTGEKNGLRVAIIGGGPSGLSAAHFLARSGFAVSIYDSHAELGGMLRYGIPEYRLPKELLARELGAMVTSLGIELHMNAHIDTTFEQVASEYDFVVVSVGAHRSRALLDDHGREFPFMSGLQFLSRVADKSMTTLPPDTHHICVIGGGNTAIDVARSAKRLGAAIVTVIYRRTEEDMPAHKDEIEAAKKEGVQFMFLTIPVWSYFDMLFRVRLECMAVQGEPEGGKKLPPVRIPNSQFGIDCDMVLSAIGEEVDLDFLGSRDHTFTSEDDVRGGRIYSSGDALYGPRSVSEAIASGKKVAEAIIARVSGSAKEPRPAALGDGDVKFYYLNKRRKNPEILNERSLTAEELRSFAETTFTITSEQAVEEADRCINCGSCIACDRCLDFCPDFSITKQDGVYVIDLDMCKGCGLCAQVCERGAIVFGKEQGDVNT
ncbi:MAG: Iron-sulfur-binding protein, glutamate synthase DsrL/GltD [Candidatus Kaiserbacteria bacterium GW2011_GWB1_52_6]|uniref:Iron-sulfur-binding protein, glutamate synthase DsrL/GltD n=2 Tax=Candidatus Kaiseribacteriota TaxID=1752734 RepID=A0A0G1ZIZ2_9BACT|nr:MAG: Iron-sulfur-binding protein, glutamate synthase DsrL/GltD [Candidatus Kaiserbacteria bacterium GW2011_GWA2_52_12]KKW27977.1 MAG: Iron-sulfur-binding protein, glutamate synthase DsrL/GltD [Candidatus Kaiserbacteria bacterium GW2011_GWB1_52_6]